MRVTELRIDELDELTGFDAVALVEKPAHMADFHAFADQNIEDTLAFQTIKVAMEEMIDSEKKNLKAIPTTQNKLQKMLR